MKALTDTIGSPVMLARTCSFFFTSLDRVLQLHKEWIENYKHAKQIQIQLNSRTRKDIRPGTIW